MFPNLRAEMGRNRMTAKELSGIVGITPESMRNKLSGETDFKLGEMKIIQTIFPGCSLEYLFAQGEEAP